MFGIVFRFVEGVPSYAVRAIISDKVFHYTLDGELITTGNGEPPVGRVVRHIDDLYWAKQDYVEIIHTLISLKQFNGKVEIYRTDNDEIVQSTTVAVEALRLKLTRRVDRGLRHSPV